MSEDEISAAACRLDQYAPITHEKADAGPASLNVSDLEDVVALTASLLSRDLASGEPVTERLLRDRLVLALGHLTEAWIQTERHVPIPEFQGVGPVDITVRSAQHGPLIGLIECKWSIDLIRDKIYEGAWDAIKLALATRATPHTAAFLVTAAPAHSWTRTKTPDLFDSGNVDTRDLWDRAMDPPGLAGATTIGASCRAGGRGNMFTHATSQLKVSSAGQAAVTDTEHVVRASRIGTGTNLIRFAADPEFPARIDHRWLTDHVPNMPDDAYQRLLLWPAEKRWTEDEIARRVRPLRTLT